MAQLPLGTCLLNAPSHSQLHRAWVDARMYADLDTAIDEIGTTYKTLAIPSPRTLNRNGTVASNIHLLFFEGGVVDHGAYSLTLNQQPEAPQSQIFNGSGTVVFSSGCMKEAWSEWWGTTEGVLQKATDATKGKHIPVKLLGNGTYLFDSTLAIDTDHTMIEGPSFPTKARRTEWESGIGATLRYTGTATGLLVGNSPDTNGTRISGVQLKNFLLMVTQDTEIAMRVWHPYGCSFNNISIFGNSDNDTSLNIGLKVEASQWTSFDYIDINGAGIDDIGYLADKALGYGLYHTSGYNNTVPTTTDYNHIYVHYCDIGVYQNSFANFFGSIVEATKGLQGVEFAASARGKWDNAWFEDNQTTCCRFIGTTGFLHFSNTHFNHGTKHLFFRAAGHGGKLRFEGCRFASTYTTPQIFDNNNAWTGEYNFDQCEFLANTTIFGSGKLGWHKAKIENMQLDVLRFIQTNVQASQTYNPVPRGDGNIGGEYYMPQKGNIIGLNIYYPEGMTAGTHNVYLQQNGTAITSFSYPAPPSQNGDLIWNEDFLKTAFVANEKLTYKFTTDAAFAPTGGTMLIETYVAYGADGLH